MGISRNAAEADSTRTTDWYSSGHTF